MDDSTGPKIFGGIVGLVFVVIFFFALFGSVPTGYEGIPVLFGAAQPEVLGPGVHMKWPFVEHIVSMDTQIQADDQKANAATSDLQTTNAEVVLNFHLNPANASKIYSTIGTHYEAVVISPVIQESFKAVSAQFTAQDLIDKRDQVAQNIQTMVSDKLQPYGIFVDNFNITNFDFSKQFDDAVEAKQVAAQQAQQAQLQLETAKTNAQQIVAQAQAQAEAMKAQQQQLTPEMIEYQAIQKWDGHLPQYMSPNTAIPFIGSATTASASSSGGK